MAEFRLFLPDGQAIMASLDSEGVLAFVIQAGEGSPIRGTEMFDLMMRAFGTRVQAIDGVWRKASEGGVSTNLDKVNELTAAGLSLEDAVHSTWTATRAARWGFRKVTLVGTPEGRPGSFTRIDVRIEKLGDVS